MTISCSSRQDNGSETVNRSTVTTIGINGRYLCSRVTGVERYAHSVAAHLIPAAARASLRVLVFAPAGADIPAYMRCPEVEVLSSSVPRNPFRLWEQVILPLSAQKERVDLLFNLTNTAPVAFSRNILTLHDVSWLENPEWFTPAFRLGYSLMVPPAARRALRVITVSECSRNEIIKHLKIDASRISVIHEGVGAEFRAPDKQASQRVLDSYSLRRPFLLHVGTVQPRKNIQRLISAYSQMDSGDKPDLVLIGGNNKHFAGEQTSQKADPGIKWLGYVPDCDLPALYSQATAYVSASLYEGFNLTILEAMACGAATVLSSIPVHHEVAETNALFFDPLNESSIVSALNCIWKNDKQRMQLSEDGLRRASQFKWESHAEKLLSTAVGSVSTQSNLVRD